MDWMKIAGGIFGIIIFGLILAHANAFNSTITSLNGSIKQLEAAGG